MKRRRLGAPNRVHGCPGWYYGLRIVATAARHHPTCTFSVVHEDGRTIDGIHASAYRTTTLARHMGVRGLPGYQQAARDAIRRLEAATKDSV